MRVFQGLGTPTKKPGFYRISELQSIIVVKNPVSGPSRSGFLGMGDRVFRLMGDRVFGWMGDRAII